MRTNEARTVASGQKFAEGKLSRGYAVFLSRSRRSSDALDRVRGLLMITAENVDDNAGFRYDDNGDTSRPGTRRVADASGRVADGQCLYTSPRGCLTRCALRRSSE